MEIGLQPTQESRAAGTVDDTRPEHKGRAPKTFEGIDRLLAAGGVGKAKEGGKKGGMEGEEEEKEEEREQLGRKEAIVFQQVSEREGEEEDR